MDPLIGNDAVVFGVLLIILALIFHTSHSENKFWKKFYTFIPALLLCYFIPGLLNSVGIISGEKSGLYFIATRYFLPASLVLLTLSIDFKGLIKLGPKAIIMTLTGTIGIVLGGPISIMIVSIFSPETVGGAGPDAVWRGLATIAGDWIGGGANQTAMLEVFGASDQLFSQMITVSVIVGYLWMGVLLYGAGIKTKLDNWLKADSSSIDQVQKKIENYNFSIQKYITTPALIKILAVAFGVTAAAHLGADLIAPYLEENFPVLKRFSLTSGFFWIVIIATTGGLILSFTKLRDLEGSGASKIGSTFLYILVATIGMSMDITAIAKNPGLFIVAVIWILFHVLVLLIVGKIIKSPYFFIAVGSMSNIGGAASAPIVASSFHPALAPVGVLLAVVGYAVGTYAAWLSAILMSMVAP
jgi:uncharacterized membrane protein